MRYALLLALVLAAPISARADLIAVSSAECRILAEHVPAPDVAYKPGVDVRGRPVAPAELTGSVTLVPPDEHIVYLQVDLRALGFNTGPIDNVVSIGTVTTSGSRVYIDGAPLHDDAAVALAEACRQASP